MTRDESVKRNARSLEDIPEQHARTAVVTGANTGLGFAIADGATNLAEGAVRRS